MGAQSTHLIHLQNKVHHPRTAETMYLSEWLHTDYIPSTQFAYCKQGSEETHIATSYILNTELLARIEALQSENRELKAKLLQATDGSSSLLLPILLSVMNYT